MLFQMQGSVPGALLMCVSLLFWRRKTFLSLPPNLAGFRSAELEPARLRQCIRKGLFMLKLILKSLFPTFVAIAVATLKCLSRVRCCIFPVLVAVLSLGIGCGVGFCFCGIDPMHLTFEVTFVTFGIIAHIHLNEAYKRAHRRNDGV